MHALILRKLKISLAISCQVYDGYFDQFIPDVYDIRPGLIYMNIISFSFISYESFNQIYNKSIDCFCIILQVMEAATMANADDFIHCIDCFCIVLGD